MRRILGSILSALLLAALHSTAAVAQLRGHGGPVRALAVSADGLTLLSGSFDTAAIRWSLARGAAEQVLRYHSAAVNAVAFMTDGHVATAGADGRVALWTPGEQGPERVLEGHAAPVAALALSPDGSLLASASWDGTARLWPLAGGAPTVLEGHRQNVNGVAFGPGGSAIISAGYDATIRIWRLRHIDAPQIIAMPAPLNALAIDQDGEIAAAGSDGKVYFLSPNGAVLGSVDAAPGALTALAISSDGALVAAAHIGGVAIIDRHQKKALRNIAIAAAPVWALAFLPARHDLLTGGGDGVIRLWKADTGENADRDDAGGEHADPLAAYGGDPGARVFRACVACHTLDAGDGPRAGPSLHGIFGRRIATLSGYPYSPALKQLEIVWTPETIAKLFELGPATYTPGTKMPEQRIGSTEDRAALVQFLERATR